MADAQSDAFVSGRVPALREGGREGGRPKLMVSFLPAPGSALLPSCSPPPFPFTSPCCYPPPNPHISPLLALPSQAPALCISSVSFSESHSPCCHLG